LTSCNRGGDQQSEPDLHQSAVGIVAEGCSLVAQLGSGVVLETEGQIVTAAHPIKGATTITVIDSDGAEHAATVQAFDKDSDLALIHAPTLEADPLSLGDPVMGAGILLVWSSDDGTTAKTIEIIRRLKITIEDIYVEETVHRSGLEIGGEVEIGDSGGAVVAGSGEVVGIVYASSRERDGIGFATDSTEIQSLLADRSGSPVDNGHCT
jgi:S1-C subfamily serine protease